MTGAEEESAARHHLASKTVGVMVATAIISIVAVAGFRQSLSPFEVGMSVLVMILAPAITALAWAAVKGLRGERL